METGLVIKSTGSWYRVKAETGEMVDCRIVGKMRVAGSRSTNPIAVGDKVLFERETPETGIIRDILDRKNYIVRRSTNLSKESHVIAANIDIAYLMVTLNSPKTLLQFIDRFLVTAHAYSIPVIILFNKIDLCAENDLKTLEEWEHMYQSIGYNTMRISVKTNYNIDILKEKLTGTISLVSGNSGVGKSSLINAIDALHNQKTMSVSKSNKKGMHATTFAEMFPLPSGGYIIDTPGLKGFGLVHIAKEEVCHYFPEMFELSKRCDFANCSHIHEPGCEVLKALDDGRIYPSRYNNYVEMLADTSENKYRR